MGAEAPVGINPLSCPLEIDNDIKAMFPPAEAIGLGRLNIDVIYAGAKHNAPSLPDKIVAFVNCDFRFAFAISIKEKLHFPASNPLSFDERVGRYVEVLNSYSIATPASPPSLGAANIRGSGDQHRRQCSP